MPQLPIYDGSRDPREWLRNVDALRGQEKLSEDDIYDVARLHLSTTVRVCVDTLAGHLQMILGRDWTWNYYRLRVALCGIYDQFQREMTAGQKLATGAIKTAAVVGVAFIAAPVVAVAGLGILGFGAGGVVAGSIAAGIQSAVYGGAVASGSLFALCQSLAMGGAAVTAAVAGTGAAGAGAITAVREITKKRPSSSWADGPNFVPSEELLKIMLEACGAMNILSKGRVCLDVLIF